MSSLDLFFISLFSFAMLLIAYVFRSPKAAKQFFKTPNGRGVYRGILLFLIVGITIAWFGNKAFGEVRYFTFGEVFLGVDRTRKLSPMCEDEEPDNRLTSNGGIRLNLAESEDERFQANFKYTHHSCAFSRDREGYDAFGLEFGYKFFERKTR